MSKVKTICDAVCADLTSAGYTATVDYIADLDIPSVRSRKILVCPAGETVESETRNTSAKQVTLSVVWLEKIATTDIDARVTSVEAIADLLLRRRYASGIITACRFSPIYDADWMRQSHIFISSLNITVRCF